MFAGKMTQDYLYTKSAKDYRKAPPTYHKAYSSFRLPHMPHFQTILVFENALRNSHALLRNRA